MSELRYLSELGELTTDFLRSRLRRADGMILRLSDMVAAAPDDLRAVEQLAYWRGVKAGCAAELGKRERNRRETDARKAEPGLKQAMQHVLQVAEQHPSVQEAVAFVRLWMSRTYDQRRSMIDADLLKEHQGD